MRKQKSLSEMVAEDELLSRMSMKALRDKARGMIVGLAVGDALGAPVEYGFSSEQIKKLGDKIEHFYRENAYPSFRRDMGIYPIGFWTDDTSMALCLADSFLEKRGYDSYDIMDKFARWLINGYRSSSHRSIGVGQQCLQSIFKYRSYPTVAKSASKPTRANNAGNGAIMRLAPVIIANTSRIRRPRSRNAATTASKNKASVFTDYENQLKQVMDEAVLSCRETHNSATAEAITMAFAAMLFYALTGKEKPVIQFYGLSVGTASRYSHVWHGAELDAMLEYANKPDTTPLQDLWGYIVHTFTIATWGLMNFDNFKDGMLAVIRLGGDTDTNAACYGQLAGAYYGYKAIPEEWRKEVYLADELVEIADKLIEMPKCPILRTRFEDDEHFEAPGP